MKWRLWASLVCFVLLAILTYAESTSASEGSEILPVEKYSASQIDFPFAERTPSASPLITGTSTLPLSTITPLPRATTQVTVAKSEGQSVTPANQFQR
jgi:hypothetical protein